MIIKPYSAFTSDLPASKFPRLLIYFHKNDLAADGLSIACRVSGVTATFNSAVSSDADGFYSATDRSIVVSGTMPTPQGFNILAVSIGKPISSNVVIGLQAYVGSGVGYGFNSNGVCYGSNGAAQNTAPGTTGVSQVGDMDSCQLTYYNCINNSADTTKVRRVIVNRYAPNTYTRQHANNSADITSQGQIAVGQLGASLLFGATSGTNGANGARTKIFALFEFENDRPPTSDALEAACAEMARTRELCARFIGANNV